MIKKIIFLFLVVLAIIYFRGINNHTKTNNSNSKIRIVSLSPSVTKKIIELDKTEYLVGRTFFCNYSEVKNIDVVSYLTHFNIDKIILLHPTHVISEYPIDEKSLYILKKNNINVQISLDGTDRESHEFVRGKGTWDSVISAIRLLNKYCPKL